MSIFLGILYVILTVVFYQAACSLKTSIWTVIGLLIVKMLVFVAFIEQVTP